MTQVLWPVNVTDNLHSNRLWQNKLDLEQVGRQYLRLFHEKDRYIRPLVPRYPERRQSEPASTLVSFNDDDPKLCQRRNVLPARACEAGIRLSSAPTKPVTITRLSAIFPSKLVPCPVPAAAPHVVAAVGREADCRRTDTACGGASTPMPDAVIQSTRRDTRAVTQSARAVTQSTGAVTQSTVRRGDTRLTKRLRRIADLDIIIAGATSQADEQNYRARLRNRSAAESTDSGAGKQADSVAGKQADSGAGKQTGYRGRLCRSLETETAEGAEADESRIRLRSRQTVIPGGTTVRTTVSGARKQTEVRIRIRRQSRRRTDEQACAGVSEQTEQGTTVVRDVEPGGETREPPQMRPNDVLVPTWRVLYPQRRYVIEGTENLTDDAYARRHQKPELQEKRRKRWDAQRQRELENQEHLLSRHHAGSRLGHRSDHTGSLLGRQSDHAGSTSLEPSSACDTTAVITTLLPDINRVRYIEVSDELPRTAFGRTIPSLDIEEFCVPWCGPDVEMKTPFKSRKRHH